MHETSDRDVAGRSPRRLAPVALAAGVIALALAAGVIAAVALPQGGTATPAGAEPVRAAIEPTIEGDAMGIWGRGADRAENAGAAAAPRITDIEVPGAGEAGAVGSASVPVRLYEPHGEPWATLVWAHGGSFVRGTLDWPEADWVSRSFAEAGLRVYSVDYVLASETVKAPALSADVSAVLRRVAAEADDQPLIVGGASAGAHLAVLAALDQADLALRGSARAADALILEYPTLHREQRPDPAIAAATAALPENRRFGAQRIAEMYAFYLGEELAVGAVQAGGAVVAGELPPERLALLPPTVIVNADADDLRASGEEFAEQLRDAGVPVIASTQPGTVHGYLNRPEESPRALADARQTIARFVDELRGVLAG